MNEEYCLYTASVYVCSYYRLMWRLEERTYKCS